MYKVFYYRSNIGIDPAYLILKANSVEDAILKADIDPTMIYGVYELDEWLKFCEERRGIYNNN